MSYVSGSTTLKNASNPNGKSVSDNLTTSGINIGNYTAGSNAYVKFIAKVNSESNLTCGMNTLTNTAVAETNNGSKQDTAVVKVNKECKPKECKPGIPEGDARCNTPKECKPGIPEGDKRCTPEKLPETGAGENILAALGLGALVTSIGYYVASRRQLANK